MHVDTEMRMFVCKNRILAKCFKTLLAVLSAFTRVVSLLVVVLAGLFGGFVLTAAHDMENGIFGLLMLGLAVGVGVGLCRRKVTWWMKVALAVLVLFFVGAVLPSTSFVANRKRRTAHECFVREGLNEFKIATIDFSPPSTLLDAIKFFKETDRTYSILDWPLEIVVEARNDAYKTRPLPAFSARSISFYNAIQTVADQAGFTMEIRDKQVVLKER